MAFNPDVKRKIVRDKKTDVHHPCLMCGAKHIRPDAAHIIDEKEWKSKDKKGNDSKFNGIPLCPNCHRVFDEVLRPRLYKALLDFGANGLPSKWERNNKISV
jgi:predicted restriction endonuclease